MTSQLDILYPDPSTTIKNKFKRIKALYNKWLYEDTEEIMEGKELITWQQQRCKAIDKVVFGFVLYNAQIEAIWTLFYEQKDLLLMVKTMFEKNLIFQLFPFMIF